jgi:hypothetical protein
MLKINAKAQANSFAIILFAAKLEIGEDDA